MSKWSKMTEAEKKAYYAARKARRAAKAKAKAKAKPEQAKATATAPSKKCAKKCKVCKCAKNALTPEERLLKAIGVEKPQYCDTELAMSQILAPFRRGLRAQAKKVSDECRVIIDAVARLMREFDQSVYGVSITNVSEVPQDVIKADKKAAKKAKKAKK